MPPSRSTLDEGLSTDYYQRWLRTYTHRDGRVFTQLWVDRWEVPTKVMMTKALYYEVFQSELLPYQVFSTTKPSQPIFELYVDKRRIGGFCQRL